MNARSGFLEHSLVGFYMILHIGRATASFYRAEKDPLDSDVLIADGYAVRGDSPEPGATD